jgi:hypothetical protein
VLYFVQSDVPTLRGGKPLEHAWPKLATALGAIWPALRIAAAWPIALVELAYANMARARRTSRWDGYATRSSRAWASPSR